MNWVLATAVAALIIWWSARVSGIALETFGDRSAPWSAHVAITCDVLRNLSKIHSRQLVSPSPLAAVAPSQCNVERLKRHRVAQSALPSNSPQEASVAHLLGPALSESVALSQLFSKLSVASQRYLKSECEVEMSVICDRVAAARGQLPVFRLRPIHLKRVDEHAAGQVTFSGLVCRADCWRWSDAWNVANAMLVSSVNLLISSRNVRASCPRFPVSDQDPTRILHDDLWSRRLRGVEFVSFEVITGVVLEAGARMKFEASPRSREGQCESQEVGPRGCCGVQESGEHILEGCGNHQHVGHVGRGSPPWRDTV